MQTGRVQGPKIKSSMNSFLKHAGFGLLLMSICLGCRLVAAEAALQFTAQTNRPEVSTFVLGETVEVTFEVNGAADPSLKVEIRVADEYGKTIAETKLPLEIKNGKGTAVYKAPNGRYGFYRVYAKLSNGVILPETGSRFAGMMTYCIVVDPTRRILYPSDESYFGMQGGFTDKTCKLLPYLGLRWVMDGGYFWGRNDPDRPGEFAEKLAAAQAAGKSYPPTVKEIFGKEKAVVNGKPVEWKLYASACSILVAPKWAWLVNKASSNGSGGAITADGEVKASEYAELVGRTLSKNYPDEARHVYEITWEPMYPWGYTGTPDDLVHIYKIAYEALHKADLKAVVIGPASPGMGTLEWHEELFKRGLLRYLDGVSIHPYQKLPPERNGMIGTVRKLKELIRKYSGKDIPLYGTESGFAETGSADIDLAQAYGMIRHNLIFMGEGAKSNISFYIHDIADYGYYYNLGAKNQCGSDKLGPKPLAPAFAAMSYLLDGHVTAGPIDWLGGASFGYIYDRPDDIVMVLWDYGDTPREVSVPVGVDKVEVYDWMGNMQNIPCKNGVFKATLTQAPIYVKGVSPKLWGRSALRPVKIKQSPVYTYPGDSIKIEGTVQIAEGKTENGTLTFIFDSALQIQPVIQKIKARVGKKIQYKVEVPVGPKTIPGSYGVSVLLKNNGNAIAGSGAVVELQPIVSVESVKPCFKGQLPSGLEVVLKNAKDCESKGSLFARIKGIPEAHKTVEFSIPPHKTILTRVEYPGLAASPLESYQATVEVKLDQGSEVIAKQRINYLAALKMPQSPKIDGALDEWTNVPSYTLQGLESVVRAPKSYAGASATFRYAWDDKALYMLWDVTSPQINLPTPIQVTEGQLWAGESIQLSIDLDHSKEAADTGNNFADMGAHRSTSIDVALTSNGPMAWCHKGVNGGLNSGEAISQDKLRLAVVKKTDTSLVYELAIPWSSLGADRLPAMGDSLGVSVEVHNLNKADQGNPSALGFGDIHDVKKQMSLILVGAEYGN